MRLSRNILAGLLLSAYLLTDMGGLENLVLCFGRDGHIALEFATAANACAVSGRCGEKEAAINGFGPGSYAAESVYPYGHCKDVPLGDRYRQPVRKKSKSPVAPETPAYFFQTVGINAMPPRIIAFSKPHLPILQTIPLRI